MKEIVALVIAGLLVLSLVYPLALAQEPEQPEHPDQPEQPEKPTQEPGPGEQPGVGENDNFTANPTGGQGGLPFSVTTLVLAVVIIAVIGATVALLARRRKPIELPPIPP